MIQLDQVKACCKVRWLELESDVEFYLFLCMLAHI